MPIEGKNSLSAQFDAVIIGGGIDGASTAQHLSAAGYRVLLIEKNDFASGATARSSRLLHNGLRYLAPSHTLRELLRNPSSFIAGIRMTLASCFVSDELSATISQYVRKTRLVIPIFAKSNLRGWQIDWGARFLKYIGRRKAPLHYE